MQRRLFNEDRLIMLDLNNTNVGMYHGHPVIFDVDNVFPLRNRYSPNTFSLKALDRIKMWKSVVNENNIVDKMKLGLGVS